MPELTDLSVIRTLCEKYDFALSKGFGQNFIINPGLPPKIVDASGVDKNWGVLEIGPGIGVLTKELACRLCWPKRWPVWIILSWYYKTF